MFDIHYIDDNGNDQVTYAHDPEQAAEIAIMLSRRYERAWVNGADFQDIYEYGHHAERIYYPQDSNDDDYEDEEWSNWNDDREDEWYNDIFDEIGYNPYLGGYDPDC